MLLGEEELQQRSEERAALRQATAEFEKKWEEDRAKTVEAGKEEMAMQVNVHNKAELKQPNNPRREKEGP